MTEQRKNPGRPVGSTKEPTKPVGLRLTEVQRVAWNELGGARWAKRRLDEYIKANKGKS